jgi:hypothetical protein
MLTAATTSVWRELSALGFDVLWGVKTQVASRGTTICRQNADFDTPHATRCRHPERTLAAGQGVLEIEARGWQYPNPNCRPHRLGSPNT